MGEMATPPNLDQNSMEVQREDPLDRIVNYQIDPQQVRAHEPHQTSGPALLYNQKQTRNFNKSVSVKNTMMRSSVNS